MAKKQIGAEIPQETADRFDAYVARSGLVKWRAIEAAFQLLECAHPTVLHALVGQDYNTLARLLADPESAPWDTTPLQPQPYQFGSDPIREAEADRQAREDVEGAAEDAARLRADMERRKPPDPREAG